MAKGHRSKIKRIRNQENKETRPHASVKHIRLSSTKAKIVLDEIKGKNVVTASALLEYSPRYASAIVLKVLKSAMANAENNLGMDTENLFVEEVFAEQGPTLKRIRPRAKGTAYRILKQTSHVRIILNER